MPETYEYKARDKAGNIMSGTVAADNEALVLQKLREQGYVPLEVGKQKRGMNIELSAKKVKLKELAIVSRQFATMVNSGLPILRALSILADQTENAELARGARRGPDRRRAGRLAVGCDRQASEGVQQPVRRDGQVG